MGEGRQDQKAAPVKAGTDPGVAKASGKTPPLPPRGANGAPSPRAPQVAAQDMRPITPGSGISPVASVAGGGPAPPFMPAPSAPPPPKQSSPSIPIDTEPPIAGTGQSGGTAPPPPELAPPDAGTIPRAAPVPEPTPVDFDALHAALGEGSREAAPPAAAPPPAAMAKPARPVAADSQGRSSATYASSRAQAPPAAHVDADLAAPAVIIAPEDTVPAAVPQMTTPLAPPVLGLNHPASGPHQVGPPSSGGMRAVSPHAPTGNTPQAFNPAALGLPPVRPGQVALTMRMPERPRRPRTPTVVVRPRGPSARQKFFVFSIMLLLVSLIGLGIVVWRAPQLFGFGTKPPATATAKPAVSLPPVATTAPTPTVSAAPITTASAVPALSASAVPSAKPGIKPKGK
jgi:hypothetical protein